VARIDRSTFAAEVVLRTPSFFTVGTDIISGVYGENLDATPGFDILYVSGDSGDDLFLCPPAQVGGPVFNGEWLTAYTGDDEGLGFDRANGVLYRVDEGGSTAAAFR
jgi:hypothetical protein